MKRLFRSAVHRMVPDPIPREQVYVLERSINALWQWYTDPTLRNCRNRLAKLQGSYAGNRCFIMGNGPSLSQMNLDILQGEYVWGQNRCYLLFDRILWRPAFYISVDTRVTPDNADEINDLFAAYPKTLFFFPTHFRIDQTLRSAPNTFWYHETPIDEGRLPDGAFTIDATDRVYSVSTVTIAAMQLAVFLGFNPIYLIGCDTNYRVPDTAKFEDPEQFRITATQDDDVNHFVPNYFGVGKKYHQPHPERMIAHYRLAKQVCDRLGVSVVNATVGGQLEVFPRIDYDNLF